MKRRFDPYCNDIDTVRAWIRQVSEPKRRARRVAEMAIFVDKLLDQHGPDCFHEKFGIKDGPAICSDFVSDLGFGD